MSLNKFEEYGYWEHAHVIKGELRTCPRPMLKLLLLDKVFHNLIIALERLETFLEIQRNGEDAAKFATTGMHGERDLHDDQKNPPTLESMLGEVRLHCVPLFFQTEFDD